MSKAKFIKVKHLHIHERYVGP